MVSLTNKTMKYAQEEKLLNGLSNRVYNILVTANCKSTQISYQACQRILNEVTCSLWQTGRVITSWEGFWKGWLLPFSFTIRSMPAIAQQVWRTWEELTSLLLSLHQSMHRTLFPWPLRVLLVFMTNCPRASTRSATWCTARTRCKDKTQSRDQGRGLSHTLEQGDCQGPSSCTLPSWLRMLSFSSSAPIARWVKNLPALQETCQTQVQSLGREDPLEEQTATHSSILHWRIPWTEEPGRLQSKWSQRVGHNWATQHTQNTEGRDMLSFPVGLRLCL